MFDLAQPRIVPLTIGKSTYVLTLAPPKKEDWLKYFDSIINTSERIEGKLVTVFDTSAAKTELAQGLLTDASGYRTRNDQPIAEIENWQKLIPLAHCNAAGDVLASVSVAESDDAPLMLGGEVVRLEAYYSANEDRTAITKVSDLTHSFSTPSIEHQRRYARSLNRSLVVGGSRTAKTMWPGGQKTLIEIYDELITEVDGYEYNGSKLTDRESIIRCMDAFHKVAAVAPLFSSVAPKSDETEE